METRKYKIIGENAGKMFKALKKENLNGKIEYFEGNSITHFLIIDGESPAFVKVVYFETYRNKADGNDLKGGLLELKVTGNNLENTVKVLEEQTKVSLTK